MKIALWGYGKYGRRMYESLTNLCSEDFEIVRVYDKAYQRINGLENELPIKVYNPEELPKDYKAGLFEKVLVCMFDPGLSSYPKKRLKELSIPEMSLGSQDDFYPMSAFTQGEKPFTIQQDNYSFCVLKNLCGAMANYESNELMYLFDREGKVLRDHWNHWCVEYAPCVYDYPFSLKSNKAERISFKGQYCILAKKFAGNYWHFTYQCLDVVWLLEQAGYQGKYVIPNKSFCRELLNMLDIASERVVSLSEFEHNKIYVFEEVFYVAFSVGEEKYGTPVLLKVAEYIKNKLPRDPLLPKKIYVKRVGKRKLLEADSILDEYGFKIMIPEDYSVREQMTFFFNADIVFCVHGANSTNCLYMRKNTVFVEAFSNHWMGSWNLYMLVAGKIHYLPVSPLETVWNNKDGMIRNFVIPETLLRVYIENAILVCEAQNKLAESLKNHN